MPERTLRELLAQRKHPTLKKRECQIFINMLAARGGREYVLERLSRFPAEASIAFFGRSKKAIGSGSASFVKVSSAEGDKDFFAPESQFVQHNVTGRVDRAHLINHCGRAIEKKKEFVFGTPPVREGIDVDFALDVTRSRVGINQFWGGVSKAIDCCGWTWVSVDGPAPPVDANGRPIVLSVSDKMGLNIRPYWSHYHPNQVVDWCFDANGDVAWLITEHCDFVNDDPRGEPRHVKTRVLWEPGVVTQYVFDGEDEIVAENLALNAPPMVPFIPVGNVSPEAIAFDDLESIQRSILDLTSANHESLFKQVYPQLILPSGTLQETASKANMSFDEAADRILGLEYPIEEDSDTKMITRYITPTAADLKILREDIDAMKRDFWQVLGDALERESRQVESAEAKKIERIDIESVLRSRADMLEEAETKLVQMTKVIDPNFKDYQPIYSRSFDTQDFESEMKSYIGLSGLEAPREAVRELGRSAYAKAREVGLLKVDDDVWQDISTAFDEMAEEALPPPIILSAEEIEDAEVIDLTEDSEDQ